MMRDARRVVILILVIAVVLNGAAVLALHQKSLADAYRTATSHQPERFTELYFNDPDMLPRQLVAGKAATFSFSIANREAQDFTYYYQVAFEGPELRIVQPVQTVSLHSAQARTEQAIIPAQAAGKHIRVTVRIINKDQAIAFRAVAS